MGDSIATFAGRALALTVAGPARATPNLGEKARNADAALDTKNSAHAEREHPPLTRSDLTTRTSSWNLLLTSTRSDIYV